MPKILDPLRDIQQDQITGYCPRCEGEYYHDESGLCERCKEETAPYDERTRWLESRTHGLGASDAASVLGVSPWKSNVELWEEKTSRRTSPDISGKAVVAYGKAAEEPIRALFALDRPEYSVGYDEFIMIAQPERPWLFATLDGTLTEKETNRHGVLEIKTTEIMRSGDWEKWKGKVPDYYYTQILHQFLATDADFAILRAHIKWHKDGATETSVRDYHFERSDLTDDLDYLLEAEEAFWSYVTSDQRPPLLLPEI